MDATAINLRSHFSLRRLFLVALALTLIIVGVQYLAKAAEDRSAFNRWRRQVQALERGEDAYRLYQYPNAPIMGLILYPLSLLPRAELGGATIDLGALAWFLLKIGMTGLAFWWIVRIVQEGDRAFPAWAQAAAIVLAIRPIIGDLSHGNVNLLILFLVTASLYAYRRRWDFSSGVLLALAICCKVTPALFVPYFLWKRAWKSLAGCALGLGLFFVVVPGAFLGQARNWELLNSWMDVMIWPYVREGVVWTEHNNQSIPGVIYRLATDNPSFLDDQDRPMVFHNVVTLDPEVARWIVRGCSLGFLALLCWSCRTRTTPRESWRLAAEYSVILVGMLLFSERTWKHHCVTLLLPYAVLTYCLATLRLSALWKGLIIGSITVNFLFQTAANTTVWELFNYKQGAKMAQVYGAYMWGELLLLGILIALLWKYRQLESDEQFRREPQASRLRAPRFSQAPTAPLRG